MYYSLQYCNCISHKFLVQTFTLPRRKKNKHRFIVVNSACNSVSIEWVTLHLANFLVSYLNLICVFTFILARKAYTCNKIDVTACSFSYRDDSDGGIEDDAVWMGYIVYTPCINLNMCMCVCATFVLTHCKLNLMVLYWQDDVLDPVLMLSLEMPII